MYDFLLQLFLIGSLAVIIYLLARALPRVQEEEGEVGFYFYLERWVAKLPLAQIDHFLNRHFEKALRKTKVAVMRFDNFLNRYLSGRKNGSDSNSGGDFLNHITKKD